MSQKGSVFQKGGGGTNFEAVQTAFLLTLIIHGNAPCLPNNEVVEIGFQNTNKGYETDDLLVIAKSSLGIHRLLIQVKHDMSFTKGNDVFKEVIESFWKDYNNTTLFDKEKDKLIVIKNGLTKDERNHIKSLFNWAVTHANFTDFILEVNRVQGKKERLDVFRNCIKEANNNIDVSDEELWRFIRCLDVLSYDFLNQGSSDETYFFNLIKLSKSKDSILNEKEIWNNILAFASKLNKDGGNVTSASIVKQELYQDFAFENLSPYFKAITKLKSDSEAILKPLKDTIGNFHLNRDVEETILNTIHSTGFTIVTGKPGTGKSAEIKSILKRRFADATIFVFRADQFNKLHLANVFAEQNVTETIQDIFSCIALIPEKIIFIDSLEKLLEADPECAFKQFLAYLKENPDIKVIASSRKYAIDILIQKFDFNKSQLEVAEVPLLNDEDLDSVIKHFPFLATVTKNTEIKTLLRSLKYLDFAVSAINKSTEDYSKLILTTFKSKLWDSLIVDVVNTKNGLPIKREDAFMEIAVNRAKEMKLFTKPNNADAEAIMLLEHDEVIFQEENNRRYAPSHDILEDWALMRYVSSKFEDASNSEVFFKSLGNEPAIRRAFRIWIEDLLINDSAKAGDLVKSVLNNDLVEKYWSDEMLIAMFKSEDCRSFFSSFEKDLLNNNAKLLNRCLLIIKNCCRESSITSGFNLLIPIGSGWKEALCFIYKYASQLNLLRTTICNFLFDWHIKLVLDYSLLSEQEMQASKNIILHYISQIEAEEEFWQEKYITDRAKGLIPILFDLTATAEDEVTQLIRRAYKIKEERNAWRLNSFYESIIDRCLSGLGNQRLIKELPNLVVEIALKEWQLKPIEEPRHGSIAAMIGAHRLRHEDCWGIKDKHSFFPSGIYKTPLYNLLISHPFMGLQFVNQFLNYAVDFYINAECEYKRELQQVELTLADGTKIKQWASEELWVAYRGLSVTHYALECLLMSLEKFMLQMAERSNTVSRENFKFVFDYLIRNSNNVAIIGVLVSVTIAYPNEVEEAMLPLLSVKEYYKYELSKGASEISSLAPADDKIQYAREERVRSNQLPHRRKYLRGLRDFVIDYQFSIGKLNLEIHKILDVLFLNAAPEDIGWKKALTEMDIRKYKVENYDEKLGGFPIQPNYEQEVVEYMDSDKEYFEAQSIALNFSSALWKAYDGKEELDFKTWTECFNYYKSTKFDFVQDRPVTLAVLGLKKFSDSLMKKQKKWCWETITITIKSILQKMFRRDFNLSMEFNLLEKKIALSSFDLLLNSTSNEKDVKEILFLIVYSLLAPLADYEVTEVATYLRATFFKHYPNEGKRVWYTLIKYAEFKKARIQFYENEESLQKEKKLEDLFIQSTLDIREFNLDLKEISLQGYESYILVRVFMITPYYIVDDDFSNFINHFILLLMNDLKVEETYSYNRNKKDRQINHYAVVDIKTYLPELFLNASSILSKQVLSSILDQFYSYSPEVRRTRNEFYEFISNTLEYVIFKLDDIVTGSNSEELKQKSITNFWTLWELLFDRVKQSNQDYFIYTLFLGITWREESVHWRPLENKKNFYHEMVKVLGSANTEAIMKVFSTIGDKTFLPDGLDWLVELYKKDLSLTYSLTSTHAESLIKRLFYNHISTIKKRKQLIDNYVWLLNQMVDLGSSTAYLFRESVITYKQIA